MWWAIGATGVAIVGWALAIACLRGWHESNENVGAYSRLLREAVGTAREALSMVQRRSPPSDPGGAG